MLLLFLSYVFFKINPSKTTENNNTVLKVQLQKSLTHINEMLADIEDKIDNETKMLSRIDYDFNNKETEDFMDYGITDIWWKTTPAPEPTQLTIRVEQTTIVTTATTAESNDIHTLTPLNRLLTTTSSTIATSTILDTTETIFQTTFTPPLIPKPLPSLSSTLPPHWSSPTTPDGASEFIKDLKNLMVLDHHGYCTAFLARFLEIFSTKDLEHAGQIITSVSVEVRRLIARNELKRLGEPLLDSLDMVIAMMNILPDDKLQEQANVVHHVLKNKKIFISREINAALDYYDSLFTQKEGEALFESLEHFYKFPDGNKNATEVTLDMLNAFRAPLMRLKTTQLKKLIRTIYEAIQEVYPNWRARDQDNIDFNVGNVNKVNQGKNDTIQLRRRSMNNNNKMRHLLFKHPTLFKIVKRRRHKQNKKNNYHRLAHKQRRHNFHRTHAEHGHLYEQSLKKRAFTRSYGHKHIADSSASDSLFNRKSQDDIWQHKEIKEKVTRRKSIKNRLHEKHGNETYRPHYRLYKPKTPINFHKTLNAKDLNDLAVKFVNQSGKYFRRLNIESSEKQMFNESINIQLVDNHILHKITQASSYTDEEDNLKNNLYDALRNDNTTIFQFRAKDANHQPLWSESTEPDDEWIIKNNIYKVLQ